MLRVLFTALSLAIFLSLTSYTIIHLMHNGKGLKHGASVGGFAVVELFTSEGCSSCPPADEAVANLLNTSQGNVYVLGFHVDYWNSLGWKDVYSDASYSQRQQAYGSVFRLNSVYTPQAVVNGKTEFTGSDTRRLDDAVSEAFKQAPAATLQIEPKSTDGKTVNVHYQVSGAGKGTVINLALVQLHAQSSVKRGENSGKVLNHVNVVRAFNSTNYVDAQGDATLHIPNGLNAKDCHVIAFTQDGDWKVTSAIEAPIR